MRPLIVITIPAYDYDPEKHDQIDKSLSGLSKDYDILLLYGDVKVRVYGIPFLIKIYYKIKAWLILKTLKKNIS